MRHLSVLAATLLISTAALAQNPPDNAPPPPEAGAQGVQGAPHLNWRQRFEAANLTHDGKLTREQAAAGGMHMVANHFDKIDTDRKGYITLQDLRAFAQARHAARVAQQQQQQQQGQGPGQSPPQ